MRMTKSGAFLHACACIGLFAMMRTISHAAYPGTNGTIAYTCYDGTYRICTINGDGTGDTALTDGTTIDEFPTWSADGTIIIFDRNGDIWRMKGDGTNQTQITTHSPGQVPFRGV